MFAKRSKCDFAKNQVEYLGHIVSGKGVSTDASKIAAMKELPTPKSLKALRGVLRIDWILQEVYCRLLVNCKTFN